ncbi:uncharacterized protein LOC144000424 [Festucalex cinctus]
MAEAAKQPKKRRVLSEDTKRRKRESGRIKGQSRINIGPAFSRWRDLKDDEGFPTDAALALFLLDYYQQSNSKANKQHLQPPQPIVSSIKKESDLVSEDLKVDVQIPEKAIKTEEVGVLEARTHMEHYVEWCRTVGE